MKSKLILGLLLVSTFSGVSAFAQSTAMVPTGRGGYELNPFDENVDQALQEMDKQYEQETGESPYVAEDIFNPKAANPFFGVPGLGCRRQTCAVYIHVSKRSQRMKVYINQQLVNPELWKVSTGRKGFSTPNFDQHPNGRIYKIYSSTKYPGYNNMPYAIFIHGGFAIHGAPGSEDAQLGRVASHGCVRVRTSNVAKLNAWVRQFGVANTWITVEP